jgi:hypothetical protein
MISGSVTPPLRRIRAMTSARLLPSLPEGALAWARLVGRGRLSAAGACDGAASGAGSQF